MVVHNHASRSGVVASNGNVRSWTYHPFGMPLSTMHRSMCIRCGCPWAHSVLHTIARIGTLSDSREPMLLDRSRVCDCTCDHDFNMLRFRNPRSGWFAWVFRWDHIHCTPSRPMGFVPSGPLVVCISSGSTASGPVFNCASNRPLHQKGQTDHLVVSKYPNLGVRNSVDATNLPNLRLK